MPAKSMPVATTLTAASGVKRLNNPRRPNEFHGPKRSSDGFSFVSATVTMLERPLFGDTVEKAGTKTSTFLDDCRVVGFQKQAAFPMRFARACAATVENGRSPE